MPTTQLYTSGQVASITLHQLRSSVVHIASVTVEYRLHLVWIACELEKTVRARLFSSGRHCHDLAVGRRVQSRHTIRLEALDEAAHC